MRILDRYIVREIAPYAILGFLLLTSVIFLHEASRFSELFIVFSRNGQSTGPLLSLIASVLPGIVVYTIPISLLLGVLMGLGRLSSDSEITAIRASGIGRARLLVPLLALGLAASGAMLYLTFELMPVAQRALGALKESRGALAYHGISTQIKPRVFEESIPGHVLFIQDIDRRTGEWKNIFIAESNERGASDGSEPVVYTARAGRMTAPVSDTALPELHLQGAQKHQTENISVRHNLKYELDDSETLSIKFAQTGEAEAAEEGVALPRVEEMDFASLVAYEPPPEQAVEYDVELDKRLAIPASCLVFALLGLAFGVSNQRSGRSYGLLVGLVLTTLYYVLSLGGEQSARNGALAPWVGVWGPNLLFAIVGLLALSSRNFRIRFPRRRPSAASADGEPLGALAQSGPTSDSNGSGEEASGLEESERRDRARWLRGGGGLWLGFPRIVDRLIVSDLMRQFAFVTAGMTMVFIVFTLFELVGQIVQNKIPATVVLGYIAYLTPQIVNYMAPLAVLVAVMVTFGLMAGGSQIIALKASGQSVYRMAVPVFVVGATISAALFMLQNYVLPTTNRYQDDLRQQIKSGQEPAHTVFQTDRQWISGKSNRIFYYRQYRAETKQFAMLSIFDLDPETFRVTRRVFANRASWSPEEGKWLLERGWVQEFDNGRAGENHAFGQQYIQLAETPDYFTRSATDADGLNFADLRRTIAELSESGFDVLDLRIELQEKIAFPLTCLVMALVGLPFAFSVGKRGALYGVAVGLAIGLVFWGALGLFSQMGRYEILPPAFAAWGPNLLFGTTGAYLFLTTKT